MAYLSKKQSIKRQKKTYLFTEVPISHYDKIPLTTNFTTISPLSSEKEEN
ncbi:MAG: hypothetical protein FWG20_03685 [Candidatus Cloacimonetes bacterium]|nr:hypothetical protein [Candidatus Cloacimonadota bacterium]